ncbi:large ribosomal subunit protein uL6-like [Corylus avellana]|uniref:large ribosomal subunit protein uL6-like n=1 Tax=Corylus avellana TaxID=13451 RepID=UPI00286B7025|nr:large ribosomal subunit protein uL6-like [Corylus avellana]
MKTILSSETMDIPDGVNIKVHAKIVEVEGPRGKLTRNFKHLQLDFQLITDEETGKRKLKVEAWFGSRKTSAAIRTALSHVENLITGVTKGYRYKMRFVYAHFPINASITNGNKAIEIRNFLGEKKVPFWLFSIRFALFRGFGMWVVWIMKIYVNFCLFVFWDFFKYELLLDLWGLVTVFEWVFHVFG